MRLVRYPLSAAKISIEFAPFGLGWKPSFRHAQDLTEHAREQGARIWWARWLFVQISYGRWV